MIPARLSLVTLGAHDVAGLRAFYKRLGWKTESTAEDFAAFPLGGAILALYDASKLAEEAGSAEPPGPAAGAFKGFTLAINVDREEQVAEALATTRWPFQRRIGSRP